LELSWRDWKWLGSECLIFSITNHIKLENQEKGKNEERKEVVDAFLTTRLLKVANRTLEATSREDHKQHSA